MSIALRAQRKYHALQDIVRDRRAFVGLRRPVTHPASECLYYLAFAGLANRLRAHLIAADLADRLGKQLVPLWVVNEQCAVTYEQLFGGQQAFPQEMVMPWKVRLIRPRGSRELNQLIESVLNRRDWTSHALLLGGHWQYLDVEQEIVSNRFPSARLAQLVDRFEQLHGHSERSNCGASGEAIAVHVRRGDFERLGLAVNGFDYYRREIAQTVEANGIVDPSFVVASDSEDTFAMVSELGPRVRFLRSDPSSRTRPEGVVQAFRDMLEMSNCRYFVLTPGSSFGAMAKAIAHARQLKEAPPAR